MLPAVSQLLCCAGRGRALRWRGLRPALSQPRSPSPAWCCAAPPHLSGRSDNGGASFLGEVFAAVKEMADSQQWVVEAVPRLHEPHLQLLAEAQGCDLPPMAVPPGVPVPIPEGASPALVSGW